MTPTEERLAITIDAILGFYSTGDAGRDRQSAAVIAKALLDDLDIDHLLAERDIDAMLNAVHGFPSIKVWEIDYLHGTIGYACEIDNTVGHPTATDTGPTRTAAIADACRKAMEGRGDGNQQ